MTLNGLRQISREVDRDAVGKDAASVERNAQQFAHHAVCPIGADEILPAQLLRLAAVDVLHRNRDAIVILCNRRDRVSFQQLRAGLLGTSA